MGQTACLAAPWELRKGSRRWRGFQPLRDLGPPCPPPRDLPKWLAGAAPATHSGIVPFSRRVRRFPTTTASARGAPSAGRAFGDALNGEATHFPQIGGSLVAFRSGRSRAVLHQQPQACRSPTPGRPLVSPPTAARTAAPQSGWTSPAHPRVRRGHGVSAFARRRARRRQRLQAGKVAGWRLPRL